MNPAETKRAIQAALAAFAIQPLAAAATALFEALGYRSGNVRLTSRSMPSTALRRRRSKSWNPPPFQLRRDKRVPPNENA